MGGGWGCEVTNDEAKAIGLRAMACKGWRWMPGMSLGESGSRLTERSGAIRAGGARHSLAGDWPDFRDPATLGCMLALVRKAWDDTSLTAVPDGTWSLPNKRVWGVQDDFATHVGRVPCRGRTEAEALVAALEAA